MLRTFSRWCAALLFGLGLTATAHADSNWNHHGQGHASFHDGAFRDGAFHDGTGPVYHDGGFGHDGGNFCHDGGVGFGNNGGCFDPCNPCNDEGCCCWQNGCVGVEIDALIWTARQDCLDYGVKSFAFSDSSERFVKEKRLRPRTNWDAGFRVGLHYLQVDEWDIGVIYTRFTTDNSRSHSTNAGTNAIETITIGSGGLPIFDSFGDQFQGVHSSWDLEFNYLDVDFSRTLCCGPCLKIRPHFGARGMWVEQDFHVRGSTFAGVGPAVVNDVFKSRFKEHFWGYGVEGGLWGDMNVGCGVCMIGHFGGSILYSKNNVEAFGFEDVFAGSSSGSETAVKFKDHVRSATASMDFFLGLGYCTHCCNTDIVLKAGWEQHVYFGLSRLGGCGANLSLQGVTISSQFNF